MKKSLFFFALLLQSCIAFAQHQLAGTVTDSIGKPVDAAVVVLMNTQDGNVIQQGITSLDGKYRMSAEGRVQIYVSCMGYKQHISHECILVKTE